MMFVLAIPMIGGLRAMELPRFQDIELVKNLKKSIQGNLVTSKFPGFNSELPFNKEFFLETFSSDPSVDNAVLRKYEEYFSTKWANIQASISEFVFYDEARPRVHKNRAAANWVLLSMLQFFRNGYLKTPGRIEAIQQVLQTSFGAEKMVFESEHLLVKFLKAVQKLGAEAKELNLVDQKALGDNALILLDEDLQLFIDYLNEKLYPAVAPNQEQSRQQGAEWKHKQDGARTKAEQQQHSSAHSSGEDFRRSAPTVDLTSAIKSVIDGVDHKVGKRISDLEDAARDVESALSRNSKHTKDVPVAPEVANGGWQLLRNGAYVIATTAGPVTMTALQSVATDPVATISPEFAISAMLISGACIGGCYIVEKTVLPGMKGVGGWIVKGLVGLSRQKCESYDARLDEAFDTEVGTNGQSNALVVRKNA